MVSSKASGDAGQCYRQTGTAAAQQPYTPIANAECANQAASCTGNPRRGTRRSTNGILHDAQFTRLECDNMTLTARGVGHLF